MVQKFLRIFNAEIASVNRAAYLLGFFALSSQILALFRDKLLAYTFGAGTTLDLYYAAFRIPDFLFVTIGSLVSLYILIPFLVSAYEKGESHAREYIDSIFTFFLAFIGIVSVVVFLASPFLIHRLFPGFSGGDAATVVKLMRVLLLSPILLGVSNLFGALTQSKHRFYVYAISPLLYNVGIIIGVVFLYPHLGVAGLAWGVALGALMHLGIQIPTVIHLNLFPRITLKPSWKFVREVSLLSVPRTITLSMSHIAIFFIISLASTLAVGSISIFNFAYNLQSVPYSIFAVSFSMASFPILSKLFAKKELVEFKHEFVQSATQTLFWVVPSSVLFIVLRAHIVRIILGAGAFNWDATRLTAATVALFAISLVLQSLTLLFVRGLYAMNSTGKPFYITMVSGAIMVVSSYILVHFWNTAPTFRYFIETLMKINDEPGSVVTMLGLGFTIGNIIEGLWIWWLFGGLMKGVTRPILSSLFRITGASVIMGFVTVLGLHAFQNVFSLATFRGVFLQGFVSGMIGIVAGIIVLILLKSPELGNAYALAKQKFWKPKVANVAVSPDTELV